MVLTPQLRQRIEMLQMTSLELSELIEQEMVANPVLEEVQSGEEVLEISDNILDQNADGQEASFENGADVPAPDTLAKPKAVKILLPSHIARTVSVKTRADFASGPETESGAEFEAGADFETGGIRVRKRGCVRGNRLRRNSRNISTGYKTQEIEYKDDAPSFEQFLSHSPSLIEHLEWQLRLQEISEKLEEAATAFIGNLDEDGRFSRSSRKLRKCAALRGDDPACPPGRDEARSGRLRRDGRQRMPARSARCDGRGESLAFELVATTSKTCSPTGFSIWQKTRAWISTFSMKR